MKKNNTTGNTLITSFSKEFMRINKINPNYISTYNDWCPFIYMKLNNTQNYYD